MKIADMARYVAPSVAGCPDFLIEQALLLAAIDFCRDTLAWAEEQDPIALRDNQSDYEVDRPSGAETVVPLTVTIDGAPLRAVSPATLDQIMPDWRNATGTQPTHFSAPKGRDLITVYPRPTSPTKRLAINGTYAPTLVATSLPNTLVNNYMEALKYGALARLMAQPKAEWSDPQLSAYNAALFNGQKTDARARTLSGNVVSTTVVRPIRFR